MVSQITRLAVADRPMFPAPKAATGPQKRHRVNMATTTKVKEGNFEGIFERVGQVVLRKLNVSLDSVTRDNDRVHTHTSIGIEVTRPRCQCRVREGRIVQVRRVMQSDA